MDRPNFLKSIVDWLREGYPNGIPSSDYVPLVALLRRRLTDDEIKQIVRDLINQRIKADPDAAISRIDVGVEVTKVLDELPSDEDIARIRERLEYKGWPFNGGPLGGETPDHGIPDEGAEREGEAGPS